MGNRYTFLILPLISCVAFLSAPVYAEAVDPSLLQWSVASLIDQSQEPFNEPQPTNRPGQFYTPRDTRGMAISPDNRYLYLGYNNSVVFNNIGLPMTDRGGEVRRVDLNVTGASKYTDQFVSRRLGQRGKALAVDDVGRVYMAETNRIDVYDATLATKLFTISGLIGAEGIAVTRNASNQLVLYSSDRVLGTLSKRILTESGPGISGASLDTSFDGDGHLIVAAGVDLRNVEVDAVDGNVWVAGYGNNRLYRVGANGTGLQSAVFANALNQNTNPFDLGFNGSQLFVTHRDRRLISTFDISQFETGTIPFATSTFEPPWAALKIDPNGNLETNPNNPDDHGKLSGIVVLPGVGFYVGNEHGQTENQHSTYGVEDPYSGISVVDGQYYLDADEDDNEIIFFAGFPQPVPEPTAIFLGLTALAAFVGYARFRKRA